MHLHLLHSRLYCNDSLLVSEALYTAQYSRRLDRTESWIHGKSSAEHGAHDDAMSFLFGRSKQKLAQDMIKSIKDLLGKLAAQDGQVAKVRTHINTTVCR